MAMDEKDGGGERRIRVRALGDEGRTVGYYEHKRRRGGEEFTIPESAFSKKWMMRIGVDLGEEKREQAKSKPGKSKATKGKGNREVL